MKKKKLVITIFIIALLLMNSGCEKIESSIQTSAPTIVPTVTSTAIPALTPEELSIESYEKFMKNEMKVSCDCYMPKDFTGEALFENGSEYTLSEVLDIDTAHYFENSADKKIKSIDYSYIDCGKDGVNELVLRLNGMNIYDEDDDSTLVYIIKYIDGKLSFCYKYEMCRNTLYCQPRL